jgi:multimeric flavodoxin WrbA
MCIQYCSKHLECVLKDDFQEFRTKWLNSDGIIWSVPIYHMGPPSRVRAAIDRMNELRFQTSHFYKQQQYPRLMSAGGAIIQGGSLYGGQEITMQFFMHHFMLLQCLPVTADMPESYMGVGGMVRSKEMALENQDLLRLSESLGQRVADMARIKKAGMLLAQDSLPDEYFPSREKMGLVERVEII